MDSQNQQASTNYKEAFSLFDKRGSGRVPLENLGDLLRACGQNPTLAEIEALEQNAGGDCTYSISLSTSLSSRRIACLGASLTWHNNSHRILLSEPLALRTKPADARLPVDFESFTKILNRPGGFREPGDPESYCRGFQVFDKDMTGFIGVGQLRYILTNLGEKMSDEEVDELLKAVDTSSGEIDYRTLVATILAN